MLASAATHIIHAVAGMGNEASGITVCVRRLAQEAVKSGANVDVVTLNHPPSTSNTNMRNTGFNLQGFPIDLAWIPGFVRLGMSRALERGLDDLVSPKCVIHSHGLWMMPNVASAKVVARHSLPLVISPHGMLGPGALDFSPLKKRIFWQLWQKSAAEHCAIWHATSEKELDDIRKFGLDGPVAVIPNGIDPLDAPNCDGVTRVTSSAAPPMHSILFLGRLHPKKGIDSLLRVWPKIARDFSSWKLDIVGPTDTHDAARYKALVRSNGIERVTFPGPVFDAEKARTYTNADLFVLPTKDENFALTVAESLICGTPVICSKGAPWAGLIEHDCGWWIGLSDDELENTLRTALNRPSAVLKSMGARGRSWMKRDFSWQSIAAEMEGVYRWLLHRRGDPPSCVRLD